MQSLFRVFYDIALWRRGPRDAPASFDALVLVAILYVAASAVQSYIVGDGKLDLADALYVGAADLGLTVATFVVTLAVTRRLHRLRQTLTAALGALTLLALPMIALLLVGEQVADSKPLSFLLALASLPLVGWYVFVVAHVVRSALDAPLVTGMAVALTYAVLNYAVLQALLPAAPGG